MSPSPGAAAWSPGQPPCARGAAVVGQGGIFVPRIIPDSNCGKRRGKTLQTFARCCSPGKHHSAPLKCDGWEIFGLDFTFKARFWVSQDRNVGSWGCNNTRTAAAIPKLLLWGGQEDTGCPPLCPPSPLCPSQKRGWRSRPSGSRWRSTWPSAGGRSPSPWRPA